MTSRASVRHTQGFGQSGRDESESVASYHDIAKRLLDFRHVAAGTLAAGAASSVMGVLFDRLRMRTVRRIRAVTAKAESVAGPPDLRVVNSAMDVVAV